MAAKWLGKDGGYVTFSTPGDHDGAVTIYLDRAQMYAVRDTINSALIHTLNQPGANEPVQRPKRWWRMEW